jgi:hypothetical protein
VLAGQDLGRGHQGRLEAARRRVGHGQRRDRRLAGAHVALQQPAHLLAGAQIGADLGEGLRLRIRSG